MEESVRMSPQDDGSFIYLRMKDDELMGEVIPAKEAFDMLRKGARLSIALNDPNDPHSHYEADCSPFRHI
ncbi:MAG: hypothetical protein ACLQNE_01605 [Thermoguttaceae bacterium]